MNPVVESEVLEHCTDSSIVKEIRLRTPMTQQMMEALSDGAKLSYYPDFPRPYFRIEKPRAYVIQGVIGNTTFRVTLMPHARENEETELVRLLDA